MTKVCGRVVRKVHFICKYGLRNGGVLVIINSKVSGDSSGRDQLGHFSKSLHSDLGWICQYHIIGGLDLEKQKNSIQFN